MKLRFAFASLLAVSAISLPAWADKIAVLPFSSPKNVPKPELEQVRASTREAVQKKGHTFATPDEMVVRIYPELAKALVPVARESVLAHLVKLEQEGRAAHDGERWRLRD